VKPFISNLYWGENMDWAREKTMIAFLFDLGDEGHWVIIGHHFREDNADYKTLLMLFDLP
jgi:hypothetical protein